MKSPTPETFFAGFRRLIITGLVACILFFAVDALGANRYSVASGNWNSTATWSASSGGASGASFPVAGDVVFIERGFTVTISANAACASVTIGGIAGGAGAGVLTFSGAFQLTVSGNMAVGGAGVATRIGTLTFVSGSTITAGSVTLGNAGATPASPNAIDMTAGGTLSTGSFTVNSATITNFWIPGTGTVQLTAANTLPTLDITSFNNLTINSGTTDLAIPITISGALNVLSGTLDLNANNITTVGSVSMTGTTITGTGTMTLAGDITTNASAVIATISAPVALGATRVINVPDGAAAVDLTITSIVSGSGAGITKQGAGLLNLSGSNTYTGTNTIGAGTLRLGAAGVGANTPLGTAASGTSVTSGAVLDLNGFSLTAAEPLTINGTGIASGGALTNSAVGAATYSGLITLGSSSSIIANSGTINLTNAGTITGATFDLTLGGTGNGSLSSIIGTTSGGLIKGNAGTWTISGNSTYTGATTISAGTLRIGAAAGSIPDLSPVSLTGALDLGGNSETIGSLTGAGTVTNSVAGTDILTTGGDNSTTSFTGIIQNSTGALALVKTGTGTMTLSGNSTYTGTTTVSQGILQLGSAGSGLNGPLGVIGGITTVSSGAALDLNGFTLVTAEPLTIAGTGISSGGALINSGAGASYSGLLTLGGPASIVAGSGAINLTNVGVITGATNGLTLGGAAGGSITSGIGTTSGSLTKADAGTWTLAGTGTFTGATTINNGILRLNNTAALGAAAADIMLNSGTLDLATNTTVNAYDLIVGGTSTILSNKLTAASAGILHTLGTLSIGASTLTIDQGGNVTGGTPGVQFSNLTMTGAPVLSPATGVNLNFSGSAAGVFKLTKSGAGTLQKVTAGWSLPSDIEITAGFYNANAQSTVVAGLTTVSGGTYLASSALQTLNSGLAISGGTFTGSTGGVTTTDVTLSSGTLTAPSGTFNVSGNWSKTGGTFTPGANTVTFTLGVGTQTLNSGGSSFNNIVHNAAGTLQLSGNALTVGGAFTNSAGTFDAGGQATTVTGLATLSGGSYSTGAALQTLTGGLTVSAGNFNCSSGTVTAGGTLTVSGGNFNGSTGAVNANIVTMGSGALVAPTGAFNVAGNWTNNGGTFTHSSGTVTFNGGVQAIAGSASTPFFNVSTSGASVTSINTTTTIGNNLAIGNGTTISVASNPFTVNGTTTVGGGATGNLTFSSATGPNTFGGLVTVSSGATWNNTINAPMFFRGGITNSGLFTAGTTALYTFDTNPQSLTGTLTIPNVTVTGVTLINNNTLTVGTALEGSGILFQAATGILNIGGTSGIALISASNAGNLVNFNGSSQTINPIGYHHLTINQSAGVAVLAGATSANGTLTLTAGGINLGGNTLTLGPASTVGGAPSSTNMIIASGGGELRKQYSGTGSFLFPIGDNTGASEYSPITINVTAGSFSSAYIGISVVDAKHPSDASTVDYLDRYWNVTPSGITGGVATVTATYPGGDLQGTLGNVAPAKLTGTFNPLTNPWIKDAGSIASPFTITGATIPSGQASVFTGVTRGSPVAAAGTDKTICNLANVTLGGAPTGSGGVGTLTYSWSPSTGLSATNVANPIFTASSTGTTTYTVTVADANGSTGTDQVDVIVNVVPAAPVIAPAAPPTQCQGIGNIILTSSTPAGTATYQWYRNGVLLVGATAITYTVIDAAANSGNYTVTAIGVTPTFCASAQSTTVAVTINPLPSVTPPVAPVTTSICTGSTVTVTVTGSEAGINYQVFDGVTSVSSVVAGTGSPINLVTSALTTSTTLTVRATNPATTCTTLLTGTVGVTVNPIPAQPVPTTPGPFVQCLGTGNITLTSNTPAGTVSYQWYKNGVLIGAATGISYVVTDLVANSGNYTVTAIGAGPTLCTSIQSAPISVTINPLPSVTPPVTPVTTSICTGSTVTVTVSGSEAGINYQVFDGVTSVSSIIAGTGGAINLITSALASSTTLTVRATNPTTTCTTLLTGTVGVTVNPIPAQPVPTTPGPFVQCLGTGNITLTSNTPAGTATYQWYKNGVLIGAATGISYVVTDLVANSGNYTVTAIGAGPTLCTSIQSAPISVTINPLPSVTPPVTPVTTSICTGSTVTVTVTGSEAGINYQVFDGVTSVSSVVAGTGSPINLVTSALTTSTTLTVRATNPTTTCTTLLTGTVGVTVNPIPAQPVPTTPGPFVQCLGTGNITLTSNTPAGTATYQWYKNGVLIGAATGISYVVTDLVANSGNYTVTAIGAGPTLCTSIQSAPISVTINPLPSVTPPVTPVTTSICTGSTVTVTVSGSEAGINYQVFDGVTSVSSIIAGTGGAINLITSALATSTTLTVRATNPTTTCTTLLTGTVGVTVNPIPAQPVPTTPGPFVQCLGTGNITLTSNTPAGTVSYQWYKNGVLIGGATGINYVVTDLVANSGNYTVTAIAATPTFCTSIQSAPISVTINPLPSVTPPVTPVTTSICTGSTVTVTVTGSEAGINYQVFDGVTSVSSIIAGTGGGINLITSALATSTTLTVRATNPTTTCTTLLTGTVGVTVNPIPAQPVPTTPGPFVQCLGTGNITLTSNTPAGTATYQWYKNGVLIGGATGISYVVTDLVANSGSYTVTAIGAGPTLCTSIQSAPISVTINPLPSVTPPVTPVTTSICTGSTVTVTVSGSEAGINYQVFDGVTSVSSIIAGTGGAINLITSALASSTTLTVRATNPTTTCTTLLTGTVGVTVNPIPAQPVPTTPGPFVQCLGTGNITLTSNTPAGTATYQWYKNGVLIGAATGISYVVTDLVANSGNYTVTAIGAGPTLCTSIQSTPISATINPLPSVTPPVTPVTTSICTGSTVTVTVTGSEAGINYQVFDGVTSVSSVVAGTGSPINLVTSALTTSTTLTVRATNPTTTCTTLLTGTVGVTVNPIPAQPVPTTPGPFVQCLGTGNITLTSNTPAGTATYQWYKNGVLIGAATGINYVVTDLVANSGNYTVTAIAATPTFCTSIQSAPISVTINPSVTANAGASPITICEGTSVTLGGSPTGSGGNGTYTFSWTSVPAGFTSTASNPVVTPAVGSTTYNVLVTDGNGCPANASKVVNVNASPVLTSTLTPADICSGATFNYTAVTGTASPSFAWTRALVGGISQAASSGATAVIAEALTNTTTAPVNVTYVFVVTAAGCPGPPQNVVVVVNPNPVLSSTLTPASICDDATFNYTATSATVGATFAWSRASVGGITPATNSGATAVISEALSNSNTAPTVVTYQFTTSRLGCSTIQNVLLTVQPTPLLTSTVTPTAICSGTVFTYTATSSTTGATFAWSRAVVGGISEGASAGAANVSETLTNTTTAAIPVTYVYVVSANGCVNPSSYNVVVSVSPSPVLTSTLTPADICSGATFNYTAVTGTASPSFAWTRALVGGISQAASSGATAVIAEALTNTTTAPVNVTYVFVVTAAGCPGPPQNVVVVVNPNPVLSSTLTPASICDDATFNYTATSATVGATFAWSRASVGGITPATNSGATAVISEALSNSNTAPTVVTYQFTTSRLGCSTIQNVLLTVQPTPLLTSTVTPTAICSGTVFTYTATSSTTGATFAWSRAVVAGISEGASAGAANVSETLTNTTTAAIPVTYVYVVSANGCVNPSSYNVVVSVSPSPVLTSTLTPADICSGATFNYTAVTGTASPSFAWTRALVGGISQAASSGATAVIAEALTNTTTAPVNVTYVFVVTAAGCPGPPQNVVVVVNPNPVLSSTLTPASICDDATFNYTATSATVGATFAWSRASVGGITPATNSGATAVISEALSNSNTAPTVVTYQFTTSRLGCSTIQNVLLTVQPTPLLTSTVTPTAICSGTVFTYTATSSTTGATFAWSRAVVGGISEGASAGAANVSETLTNTTTAAIPVTYVYVVSANGCVNPSSYNVVVSVSPSPVLTSTLTPADICSGATFNYTAVTGTASPSFAWTRALVGGISQAASSGATAVIAEALTNTTTAPVNVTYVFVVTAAGCPGPPQNVVVVVNPNPVLSSTLTPASICDDATFNYTATSATVGATFAWSRASVGGITPATNSGATAVISEALSNSNTAPTVVTYQFTTSRLGCSTIQNVLLTVQPTPLLTSTVTPTAICSGTVFTYTATSSTTGATFAWSRAVVGGISEGASAGAANVSETLTNTTTAAIPVTYVYVVSANGCVNPSSYNVVVSVSPSPVLTSTLTPADICSGATFNYTAVTGTASPSFAWTRALVGGISQAASSGATAVIAEALTNTTTAPVNVTYVFVVTAAGCPGPPQNVVVVVNPNPVLSSTLTPASICDDATFNYTATSATVGATFAWSRASVGGITPATNSGATAVISEALSNSNTAPTVVTYQFTTSRLGCSTIQNVLLTVQPTPLLTSTVTPTAICSGTVFTYTATSSTTGATFAWSRAVVGGISEGASAGAANVSETLTNTTTAAIPVTYVYVVSANGCVNPSSYNVVVSVSPSPVLTSTLTPADICSGATFNYTAVTGTASPSFAWTRALVGGISQAASSGATAVIAEALTNTTTAPVNVTYVFVVTAAGCPGPPQNVVVVVNPNPVLSSTLTPASICDDATFNYTATSATVGATFAWSRASVGGITPATNSGATAVISEALSNSNTAPTVVTYQFTTSRLGCSTIQNVLLTVNPTPLLTSTVTPTAICSGTVFTYTATSSTTGATFAWSRAVVAGISEGASAGAANVSETLTNTTTAAIPVTYVYVVSANGCVNPSSYNVVVSVNPPAVFAAANTLPALCEGVATSINLTSSTTGQRVTLVSVAAPGSVGGYTAAGTQYNAFPASITDMLTNSSTSPQTVTYTFEGSLGGTCINPAQQVVTVTVNPAPPDITVVNPLLILCEGTPDNITLNSATANAVITLTNVLYNGATGSLVNGMTFTPGSKVTETIGNPTNAPITVDYTFQVSANGCTNPATATTSVQVKPEPVFSITNTTPLICEATPVDITLNSLTTNAIMTLTSVNYGAVIGTLSAGATYTNGQKITEVLNNPTNIAVTVTYTFDVRSNTPSPTCQNPVTQQTTVIVKPKPSANGTDIIICSGQNAVIPINPSPENVAGTTYDFTYTASANVVGATNDNGSLINQPITLTDFLVGTIQYHVTPTANGCVGPVKDLNVQVNPIATVNAGVDYQVCEPVTIPLSGTIGGASTSGTWAIITGAGSISGSSTSGTTVTATYTVNPSDISTTLVFQLQTNDPDTGGPCSAVSDLLNVQVNRMAFVSVPADYVVCEPISYIVFPIQLTGTIGASATTGLWSVVTGNGGLSATSISGATVNAEYVIDPSDVGTVVTFRLTTNDPDGTGPCVAVFDDINITINLRATVDAGPDLELCSNVPSIGLLGSYGGSTSAVLWSGGAGSFSNASSTTSNYFWANPSELNSNITLTLTALDPDAAGPCTQVTDQMVLTINPLPVVFFSGLPPGSPPNVAENTPPITLVGNQQGGLFTIAPATSNIGSTVQAPGDQAVFDPSAVTLGVNTITYTYTDINGCTNLQNQPVIVNPVTSATFAIQNGVFNSLTLSHEVCAEQGDLLLTGNPDFNTFGPNQFIASPGLTINQSGSPGSFSHTISTNGLPAGTYTIDYVYTNAFGATSHNIFAVKVFAAPIPVIQVNNSCIVAAIQFRDFSTLPATNPYPTTISGWLWDFDDNQFSTLQNPDHVYAAASLYDVNLKVTTQQGCTQNVTKQVRVGDVPIVDFSWSAICNNDQTKFQDQTNPGTVSVITTYTWDFGDGNIISGPPGGSVASGGSTGIFEKPDHNYSIFGSYNAKLTVATNDGCSNALTKNVFILPYTTVVPASTSAYSENFEASGGGWVAEAFYAKNSTPINIIPSDTSWVYGTPGFNKFTPNPTGPKAWWTGKDVVNKTYFPYENSAINGPCFNLNQLMRPMIALDYWSDTQRGIDGVTLQYSVDAGLTWRIIGPAEGLIDRDQGINWFNGTGISANPGNQPIGQYGWTDRSEGWKNARFNLDMIPAALRSQVRIRFALGSNDSNPANENYDGFAFDNIYVGEKQRNVLVEHFTNSSLQASVDGDTYINNLYQAQITFRGASDFYDIQYHINTPGADPLNADNVADPGARSTYMGVSQPPKTIMDGVLNTKFTGKYTDLNQIELDRRALADPLFDLQLDTIPTNNKNTISVRLIMTAKKAVNTPLIAQVAVLENKTGIFENVLRKHLFGADGETITVAFTPGLGLTRQKDNVVIDAPLTNPSQLTLVAYVQDKNTKEIYQSIVKAAPYKRGTVIVGLEDAPTPTTLNGISIYPNPANGHFYFGLPDARTTTGFEWKLIDQRGVTVKSGDFEGAIDNTKMVDTGDLANGVYIIMLSGPGKSVVHRKIVIMNHY